VEREKSWESLFSLKHTHVSFSVFFAYVKHEQAKNVDAEKKMLFIAFGKNYTFTKQNKNYFQKSSLCKRDCH
jgi:hypothetical protein